MHIIQLPQPNTAMALSGTLRRARILAFVYGAILALASATPTLCFAEDDTVVEPVPGGAEIGAPVESIPMAQDTVHGDSVDLQRADIQDADGRGSEDAACHVEVCDGDTCGSLIADAWPSRDEASTHRALEGGGGYFQTGTDASSPWVFVLRERDGQRQIRAVRINFDSARPDMRPEFVVIGVVSSPMRTNRRSFRSVMRSGRPVGSASTGEENTACTTFVFPETVREGTLIVQFSGASGRHGRTRVGQIRTLTDDELAELRTAGIHEIQLDPYVRDEASRDTSAGVLLVPAFESDTTTRTVDALSGTGETTDNETREEGER